MMSHRHAQGSNHGLPSTSRRLSRRAVLGAVAAGALVPGATVAQPHPPIEPIGTMAPGEASDPVVAPPQPAPTIPPDASSVQVEQQSPTDGQYFAETGHNLGEPFLQTWTAVGGRAVLGIPLSEARFVEGVGQIHQTFETLTLVYDPQLDPTWAIQAQLLDTALVSRIAPEPARLPVSGASGGGAFFAQTGHSLSGAIQAFWLQRGGLQLFGMPLSEPFGSGGGTSQAFEKAVIDEAADGAMTLRKTGADWVEEQGLAGDPAFVPAPPNQGVTSLVSASDGLRLRSGPSSDAETLVVLPDNAEFIAAPGPHGEWVPGYVDGYAGWVSAAYLEAPPKVDTVDLADWDVTVWQGAALGETNVRREPTTSSAQVRVLQYNDPITVIDWVEGEEVFDGADVWAKLDDGTYIYARNVGRAAPVAPPPLALDAPWEGRWLDLQLTQQLMVAYEGRTPVRTIVVTTGMPGWETPTGWYAINRRVANETMESGSIGAEDFFKLEDVLFTQYFTDRGHALHFAWWRTPETIGRPGSHGCVNMLLDDSRFVWDWATIGTPVVIRAV